MSTTFTPRHRASEPAKIRISPTERDVLAMLHAAGPAGISTENLRTRTGQAPGALWSALWALRAAGLARLVPGLEGYVAHLIP